jgi:hypothetical protein
MPPAGDEDVVDGGGSGRRRPSTKLPKEISLTDTGLRPGRVPFFAHDANYVIDNKVGIIR